MQVQIQAAWAVAVLLASLRMTALLMFTPLLGGAHLPAQARVLFTLAMGAALLAALPGNMPPPPLSIAGLVMAALHELLVGAAMGFGLLCAFAAFGFAGKLLDLQVGFSVGAVFDPATRQAAPLLGTLLTLTATALFYAMDSHHLLLKVLAYSFVRLPPGHAAPALALTPLVDQFGATFILGLTLAAPVAVALFLVDLGLGVISRTVPQMNVFLIGIVVKIGAGLMLLAATLGAMAPVMRRAFDTCFAYWQHLLG